MSGADFFEGGHLALDFLNTWQKDGHGNPVELLDTPGQLTAWSERAGITPLPADKNLLAEAIVLREAMRSLFTAWIDQEEAPPGALHLINRILGTGCVHPFLRPDYTQELVTVGGAVHPLLPLAQAAVDLLVNHDLSLVRRCEGTGCVLWFLDTTKNKRRRWCRMEACGNRSKQTNFKERLKTREDETVNHT
jgi:predicted RNA-binding Zn ribbon-like protein